jgi:hypothetical protein
VVNAFLGRLIQEFGSYALLFVVSGLMQPLALVIIVSLVGRDLQRDDALWKNASIAP